MSVQMSETMVALSMGELSKTGKFSKTLVLFDGTPPTKAEFEAQLSTLESSEGLISGAALKTWTDSISATPMAVGKYGSGLIADLLGPRDFKYSISRQYENVDVLVEGAPTWFMFITWNTTTQIGYDGSGTIAGIMIGSVGDELSSADMKVRGGSISQSVPLRGNDIEMRVN